MKVAAERDRKLAPTNDKNELLARLRRIEGQVRGLQQMVADDRYCLDILTQVAAARAALQSVGLILLENHARHCLTAALRQESSADEPDHVDELVQVLARFAR